MKFSIIAAVDKRYGLGKAGGLAWQLKGDMKHFKEITSAAPEGKQNVVIMGSKTWESIPARFRPLQGRLNVVLSRKRDYNLPEGVMLTGSINEALDLVSSMGQGVGQVFIIGGASVYNEAINHPSCSQIYLTEIDKEYDCDVYFPPLNKNIFKKKFQSENMVDNGIRYKFVEYEKKS